MGNVEEAHYAQINFPESGRGLGHVIPTIFGSTVGYLSDSLASCVFDYTDLVLVSLVLVSVSLSYGERH